MRPFRSIFIAVVAATVPLSYAQLSRSQNLQTCLSGKYPVLCDHSRLTADQLRETTAAELRENLRVCMTGKYPALCDHSSLSPEQTARVREAEGAENLRVCSSGKYPALCRHALLSPQELRQVRAAERAENLRVCMDGRYPALCKRSLLTAEEAIDVAAADLKAASGRPREATAVGVRQPRAGDCQPGHWIEAVEGDGKIIKLEDGSLWEVDDVDTVTTSIWLPISDVIVCDGKMINVDDGETAEITSVEVRRGGGQASTAVRPDYLIGASANGETFVINGEVFKAKT